MSQADAGKYNELRSEVLQRIGARLDAAGARAVRTLYGDEIPKDVFMKRLRDSLSDSLFPVLAKKHGDDPAVLSDKILWWFTDNECGLKDRLLSSRTERNPIAPQPDLTSRWCLKSRWAQPDQTQEESSVAGRQLARNGGTGRATSSSDDPFGRPPPRQTHLRVTHVT